MLQNAYFLAKIGADTAENEQHFAEILPIGRRAAAAGPGDAAASPLERFLRGFTAEGKERAARRKAVEQMAIPDGERVLEGLGISPETGVRGSIRASLAISAGNALLAFLAMAAAGSTLTHGRRRQQRRLNPPRLRLGPVFWK